MNKRRKDAPPATRQEQGAIDGSRIWNDLRADIRALGKSVRYQSAATNRLEAVARALRVTSPKPDHTASHTGTSASPRQGGISTWLNTFASLATVAALVYAAISFQVSVDAAQRESVSQTFLSGITVCGRAGDEDTPSVAGPLRFNTVLTNTGRLPITVIAIYSGVNETKELQFAGVYLDNPSEPFVDQPFVIEVGQAVALSTVHRSTTGRAEWEVSNSTTVILSNGQRLRAGFVTADDTPKQIETAYETVNEALREICP